MDISYTKFYPKFTESLENMDKLLFKPRSKVWLPLLRFLQNSQVFSWIIWRSCTPNVEILYSKCGDLVHQMWRSCTTNVQIFYSKCGDLVHQMWRSCTPNVEIL